MLIEYPEAILIEKYDWFATKKLLYINNGRTAYKLTEKQYYEYMHDLEYSREKEVFFRFGERLSLVPDSK